MHNHGRLQELHSQSGSNDWQLAIPAADSIEELFLPGAHEVEDAFPVLASLKGSGGNNNR